MSEDVEWPPLKVVWASLIALNLLIYGQVVGFGLIEGWDDLHYFIERGLLDDWWGASWSERITTPDLGYPSPIPTALHALVHQLPGDWTVVGAHALNLVFHLINVVLVFLVGERLLKHRVVAWVAALLWSSHPVLAESVAWITNLKTVGMATAILVALLVWQHYLETERKWALAATFGALIVGLGFKPPAIVIAPMVLAVTAVYKWDLLWRRETLVFAAISGTATAIYLWGSRRMHHTLVEADGFAATAGGLGQTMERVGGAFYVQMHNLVAPLELHPMYFPGEVNSWQVWVGWVLILILVVATFILYRRCRLAVAGMVIFWINYLPHSGLEYLPRFTADTYMYVSLLGLLWCLGALVASIDGATRQQWDRVLKIGAVAAIFAFGLMAFVQTARWADESALWKPMLKANPEQYPAYHMVGQLYANRGDYEEAAYVLGAGMEYFSDQAGDRAMTYAYVLERAGHIEGARDHVVRILAGEYPGPDDIDDYAVYLMVGYGAELPPPGEGREELLEAGLRVLERGQFDRDDARRAAEYFEGHGEEELARAFRQRAEGATR